MDAPFTEEIDKLYRQMYGQMREYAGSFLGSDALAEEAVHEAFRIACQCADELRESPNPPGWLMLTLKNVICNTQREEQATKDVLWKYASVRLNEVTATGLDARLDLLYEDLSNTEEFLLLKRKILDGKSHFEIAQELGISIATCRKRLQRAKEKLQKKFCK